MKYHAENQERVARQVREMEEHQRRIAEEKAYMNRYPHPLPSPPYDAPQQRRAYNPPGAFPPTPPMEPQRRSFTPASGFQPATGFQHTNGFPPTPPMEPLRYMASHGGSPHGSAHGSAHGSRPMTPATPITPISPPLRDSRYAPPPAPTPMPSPPGRLRGGNLASALAVARPNWWTGVFDGTAGSTGFKAPISPPSPNSTGIRYMTPVPRSSMIKTRPNSYFSRRTTEGSQCFGMPMDTLNMAREEIEIIKVYVLSPITLVYSF